ncbi:hypothetical protein AMK11_13400 [Streptomyces sp. CB02414]|nr:hypothetical protein AMK11_13400 [Streptomyces sp. CB02414]
MIALLGVVCLAVTLTGVAVGALTADSEPWIRSGLTVLTLAVVAAVVSFVGAWRWQRRAARRFGLTARQYTRLGQAIRRGRPPTDPAVRPAVVDIVERQRRMLEWQGDRRYRWVRVALICLWLVIAAAHFADGSYLPAALMLLGVLAFLALPLSLRRQRRRLEAVERVLGPPDQSPP